MRGGVPAETRRLVVGLARNRHEVALASDMPLTDSGDIRHFPITVPVKSSLFKEVGQALDKFQPDFVHVMCMSAKGVRRLASLLNGLPWALTVHSVPPFERKFHCWHGNEGVHYAAREIRFSVNRLAWQRIFGRALVPMSIVHSQFMRDIVCEYGASQDAVRLIPLCFEPSISTPVIKAMSSNSYAPLLVTVGGFAHSKGQHDVVKALPQLVTRFVSTPTSPSFPS